MDLKILRRTAAEIAAAAVYELYPNVELLGGSETATGFVYDFIFPHPIHLHLIEEKIKQMIREKRPIRTLEMVPFSASELLLSQGHHTRAEQLPDEALVEIIQIGAFHDFSSGPHLKNTAELAAFKISAEPLPEKRMRLTGWCHRSKDELKQFLKRLENYTEPARIGEAAGLWRGDLWLAPGLRLREKLIQFLKREWFQGAYEISGPSMQDPFSLYRLQNKPKVAEVLYPARGISQNHLETQIQIGFFGLTEGEMISSLHLIGKTLTILGFDHSISPMGSMTDFVVEDGIGRSQVLVHVDRRGNDLQVTARVEQVLEQMLEKKLMGVLENQ